MAKLSPNDIMVMLTKVGIVTRGGNSLEEIMDNALLNAGALDTRQREVIRREVEKLERPKRAKRPGYRDFVEWIALNDDVDVSSEGGPLVTITMVAHVFGKEPEQVSADVISFCEKNAHHGGMIIPTA